jgi:hypothetical protein
MGGFMVGDIGIGVGEEWEMAAILPYIRQDLWLS